MSPSKTKAHTLHGALRDAASLELAGPLPRSAAPSPADIEAPARAANSAGADIGNANRPADDTTNDARSQVDFVVIAIRPDRRVVFAKYATPEDAELVATRLRAMGLGAEIANGSDVSEAPGTTISAAGRSSS